VYAGVIAISVPHLGIPCEFKANAVTRPGYGRQSVVELRRGFLRILQSTDLWIVLASPAGDGTTGNAALWKQHLADLLQRAPRMAK